MAQSKLLVVSFLLVIYLAFESSSIKISQLMKYKKIIGPENKKPADLPGGKCEDFEDFMPHFNFSEGWAGTWYIQAFKPAMFPFDKFNCNRGTVQLNEDRDIYATLTGGFIEFPGLQMTLNSRYTYDQEKTEGRGIMYFDDGGRFAGMNGGHLFALDGKPDEYIVNYACFYVGASTVPKRLAYMTTRAQVADEALMEKMFTTVEEKLGIPRSELNIQYFEGCEA